MASEQTVVTDCSTGHFLDGVALHYIDSIVRIVDTPQGKELVWASQDAQQRSGSIIKLYDEVLRKHQPEPRNNEFCPAVVKTYIGRNDSRRFDDAGDCLWRAQAAPDMLWNCHAKCCIDI